MIVKQLSVCLLFESSVNSYDSQTRDRGRKRTKKFESSVNSYDSQTTVLLR